MGVFATVAPSFVAEPERVVVVPFMSLLLNIIVQLRNGFSVGHHAHAVLEFAGLPRGTCGAAAVRRLRAWVINQKWSFRLRAVFCPAGTQRSRARCALLFGLGLFTAEPLHPVRWCWH